MGLSNFYDLWIPEVKTSGKLISRPEGTRKNRPKEFPLAHSLLSVYSAHTTRFTILPGTMITFLGALPSSHF